MDCSHVTLWKSIFLYKIGEWQLLKKEDFHKTREGDAYKWAHKRAVHSLAFLYSKTPFKHRIGRVSLWGWHCPAILPVSMDQCFSSFAHCSQRMRRADSSSVNSSAFQQGESLRSHSKSLSKCWASTLIPAPYPLLDTHSRNWVTFSKWVWRTFHRQKILIDDILTPSKKKIQWAIFGLVFLFYMLFVLNISDQSRVNNDISNSGSKEEQNNCFTTIYYLHN